jgi:hypothetical protein
MERTPRIPLCSLHAEGEKKMIPLFIESAIAFDRTMDTLTKIEYKVSQYDAIFQEYITPVMFRITMLGLEAIALTAILFWRASLWTINLGRTFRAWHNATRPMPKQPLLLPSVSSALIEMEREGRIIARLDRSAARQSAILVDAGIMPTSRGLLLAPVPTIDYWGMGTVAVEAKTTTEPASMPRSLMLAGAKRKASSKRSRGR